MKLNYDLIRNLLLKAENKKKNNSSLSQSELDRFIVEYRYTIEEFKKIRRSRLY